MEADLFPAGGRTDGQINMMKLIETFGKVAKAPKNEKQHMQDFALRQVFAFGSIMNVFSRFRGIANREY